MEDYVWIVEAYDGIVRFTIGIYTSKENALKAAFANLNDILHRNKIEFTDVGEHEDYYNQLEDYGEIPGLIGVYIFELNRTYSY